jgi:hypothetical protein
VPQLEAAVRPDHQEADADAPQRLVEERRVVGGQFRGVDGAELRVDLKGPGEIRGPPVQLLVEPVAPPADGLREGDAGRHRVRVRGERDAAAAAADPGAQRTEGDRAPDAEAAVPDLEGVDPVAALAEVELVIGDDVVEPSADEAEGHGPHGDVRDRADTAAAFDPAATAEPYGEEDADDDAEGVAAQRDRSEMDLAGRGAGNRSKDLHGFPDATSPCLTRGNALGATAP